jgi:hypothetical protein
VIDEDNLDDIDVRKKPIVKFLALVVVVGLVLLIANLFFVYVLHWP